VPLQLLQWHDVLLWVLVLRRYYHDWLLANLGEQGWQAAAAQGQEAAVQMASGSFNSTLSSVAGSLLY
jgi:hypothetical protein